MSQPSGGWPQRQAALIARQVRACRQMRKLSVQQLSDALAELGCDMKRPVLSNFENGRRPTISVAELFALATALQVPPILLLFPVGQEETVEVPFYPPVGSLPRDTWTAMKWFTGDITVSVRDGINGGDGDDESDQPVTPAQQAAAPIALYTRHEQVIEEWSRATAKARTTRHQADTASNAHDREDLVDSADSLERIALRSEREIAEIRQEMRQKKINPPSLPQPLRHLDDGPEDT